MIASKIPSEYLIVENGRPVVMCKCGLTAIVCCDNYNVAREFVAGLRRAKLNNVGILDSEARPLAALKLLSTGNYDGMVRIEGIYNGRVYWQFAGGDSEAVRQFAEKGLT